jgi:hypothetical protein
MKIDDITPKNRRKVVGEEIWVVVSIDTSDGDVALFHGSHEDAQAEWDDADSSYTTLKMFKITYKENE